jgi:glucose-6-phosphate 1-dehydrogenase
MVRAGTGTFKADRIDEGAWTRLTEAMAFVQGDLADAGFYEALRTALDAAEQTHQTAGAAIFYLAVAEALFGPVVARLGEAGLTRGPDREAGAPEAWRRVVIEKPFGHDLASARALNAKILGTLEEDQIYRINHFLGKDTVQAIMALRFANGLFEPVWNRDRIDHVQITAAETVGVERRGDFYEHTGALRDMAPNHLLSLLTLVAMEPPSGLAAASVQARKAEVLAAIGAIAPTRAVRGQYGRGTDGAGVKAYRDEPEVVADSNVETYVALEVNIDTWRWAGVPFFLRTGKHLSRRMTEIAIRFKPPPASVFRDAQVDALGANWLVLRIAPDEGISLGFEVKRPGADFDLESVTMDFKYDDWFPKAASVGYETLLHDVMIGDRALFMSAEIVEQGWRVVQRVLDAWAEAAPDFPNYASGDEGPAAAVDLIARSGHRAWRPIAKESERGG